LLHGGEDKGVEESARGQWLQVVYGDHRVIMHGVVQAGVGD
jgi:hypothetical protein